MDAFFASVEILHNPSLKGKAFGVRVISSCLTSRCNPPPHTSLPKNQVGNKGGVLTTASYEARKFGVRSAMPGFIALKLCPDLILTPNVHSRYSEMSKRVMNIFRRYDPNMAVAGCDEGYLKCVSSWR